MFFPSQDMAIEEVQGIVSVVPKEVGYVLNGKIWTKLLGVVPWCEGVLYSVQRNGKIVTLDEAVEFRHDSGGVDSSDEYEYTGTLLASTHDGCAHLYEPSVPELLAIVAHSDIRKREHYFDVEVNSKLGQSILAFSANSGRTFVVPSQDLSLLVNTDADSEYSRHEIVGKLMPVNARKNESCIAQAGYAKGKVWFGRSLPAQGYLRVRAVGLGWAEENISGIDIGGYFDYGGRARGVVPVGAQKIQ